MLVGTCSGVTSAGIVISSAFGGTSSRKSSLTSDKMRDVFPTPGSPTNRIRTIRLFVLHVTIVLCFCYIHTQFFYWQNLSFYNIFSIYVIFYWWQKHIQWMLTISKQSTMIVTQKQNTGTHNREKKMFTDMEYNSRYADFKASLCNQLERFFWSIIHFYLQPVEYLSLWTLNLLILCNVTVNASKTKQNFHNFPSPSCKICFALRFRKCSMIENVCIDFHLFTSSKMSK